MLVKRAISKIKRNKIMKKLKQCGKGVYIHDTCDGFFHNVSIGDNSSIGMNNYFNSYLAEVKIGNHVMTGPEVMFITGSHRYDIVGRYMNTITNEEKRPSDDQDIIVEDDVWIGARATILKGVTIGEGSIVGACSVVTHDVPPYSIVAGNPAKVIKVRFSKEEIEKHKELLNK